ncbi:MAG: T9SS type A sorting domain-containing protein [Weeksellaceae bacterium]|jgi:hypothetical protein|nr:T9SS type A sorting domain-containing protein [Weeksellaceae bacterium]
METITQKLAIYIIILFGFMVQTQAQAPDIEWQKSLGGSYGEIAYSVQQTTDGGYIVAGYSESNDGDVNSNYGFSDYWIVKLNSAGSIEWQKSLGGSDVDYAYSIQQTTDGGYIVAGRSYSNDGDVSGNHGFSDYWIVKLDSTGNTQWQKSLGGSYADYAKSIQQTTDGGYIVAGAASSNDGDVSGNLGGYDYWVVKLDKSGSMEWQKSLGGSSNDYATSIQQTTDGGYIVAGYSESNDGDVIGNHGDKDYWVVKLDSTGNMEWQKSLGGSGWDAAHSIQQTTDNGYIVAGYSESNDGDVSGNHGNMDYWVVKLDNIGNMEWQKSLGGSDAEVANSIQQTTDGGYIIAGYSSSNDGDVSNNYGLTDCWIVKLNDTGNIEWQKSLGESSYDAAISIQQTTDEGYIIAGQSDSTETPGYTNFLIIKLYPAQISVDDIDFESIETYPNPTNGILNFTEPVKNITIYDISGKTVKTRSETSKIIDLSGLAKGVYIVKGVTQSRKTFERKIIKK